MSLTLYDIFYLIIFSLFMLLGIYLIFFGKRHGLRISDRIGIGFLVSIIIFVLSIILPRYIVYFY